MRRYTLNVAGKDYVIDVQELTADRFHVIVGGEAFEVHLSADQDLAQAVITPAMVPMGIAPGEYPPPASPAAWRPPEPETLRPLPASLQPPLPPKPHLPEEGFRSELRAPMPGTLLSIEVAAGDRVERGQVVAVLEAMKMKNAIKSPQVATVAEVVAQPGQAVGHGHVLLRFEPPADQSQR